MLNSVEYMKGQAAERCVKAWLQKCGCYVLPACAIDNGRAPTLNGDATQLPFRLISPDLLATKTGCSRWIEVKFKSTAPLYRKLNRRQHGISTRHMNNYRLVERESGIECWIAIIEGDTKKLLIYKLSTLDIRHGMSKKNGKDDEPMDYWDRNAWAKEVNISNLGPPEPFPARSPRTLRDPPCPKTTQGNLFDSREWGGW